MIIRKVKKCTLIIFLSYFFSFSPFFSIYPLKTDLQPLYLIFMLIVLIVHINNTNTIPFPAFILLLLSLCSLFYFNPNYPVIYKSHVLGMFASFVSYLFFRKYHIYLDQKILLVIIAFNLSAIIFDYVNPSMFRDTFGEFVRVSKDAKWGRGAAGFSSEPGFIGSLGVFYIAVSHYLKNYNLSRKYYHINIIN